MVWALGSQPLGGHGGLAEPLLLAFPLPHRSNPGRTTLPHVEQQSRAGPFAGPKPESMMVPRGARRSGQSGRTPERPPQVPSGLGMVVGIPCMANTDTKINKVYMNVITTLAACCG